MRVQGAGKLLELVCPPASTPPKLQKDSMKSLWKFRYHMGRSFKKNKNLCNIYFFSALSKS